MSHSVLRHRLVAMMCLTNRCVLYIARVRATTNETNAPYIVRQRHVLPGYNVVSYKLREYEINVRDAKNGSSSFSRPRLVPTRRARRTTTSYNTQPTGQAVGDARSVRKRARRNAPDGVIDGTQSLSEIVTLRDVHQDKSR